MKKRLIALLVILGIAGLPALAQSYYFSPDVPTDLGGTTYLPWEVVRYDPGTFSLRLTFPVTAVDSVHAMCSGNWLLSVETPEEIPPGSGALYDPRDVILYDPATLLYTPFFCGAAIGIPDGSNLDAAFLRGDDSQSLVISFDVPTDLTAIGGGVYDPADLIQFQPTGAGCNGWLLAGTLVDASTTAPPVAITSDVTGADRRGSQVMLPFDVPTTLAPPTYLPGQVPFWDTGVLVFGLFDAPPWPPDLSSRMDAFSFLPDPGEVSSMHVDKSSITTGDLTITWTPSTSAGAEDYGIYEGSIVNPWIFNHTSKLCTDAGTALTEDITPASGNRFYLVVALNPDMEGSYGRHTSGTERPQGSSPCRAAQGLDCP